MAKQRSDIMLAAMAAGGAGAGYDPVRVQKLFFLIDTEIPKYIDGPHFHFQPYHYGPFDKTVYHGLARLVEKGKINIGTTGRYNEYSLTGTGYERGVAVLNELPERAARYMEDAAKWIRLVPFKHLLAAIYRQYPSMAINSIIPQVASGYSHTSFRFAMPSFLSGMARALDFTGTLNDYQRDSINERLDGLALYHDWSAVGDDLGAAMADHLAQGTSREPQT